MSREEAAKAADSRVFVQVHTTDVEAIRAALALKPQKRKGLPLSMWLTIVLALLVGAFALWQWTISNATAENIAAPQVMAPKPPDFALEVYSSAPSADPRHRLAAHPHHRHARPESSAGN